MKNLINVLLYVLLGLLVVTIAVMIYKKFKTPTETQAISDVSEQTFIDTTGTQALPFSAEDSMVLGLTGELPSQVGPESESGTSAIQENVSPVAKPVANHETVTTSNATKTVTANSEVKEEMKKENSVSKNAESKKQNTSSKSSESTKTVNKSSNKSSAATASQSKGNYFVISGSFLVPANADKQVAKLKKLGFFNASKKVFTNSSSYSAIAGQYESEAAARASLNKLKAKGEEGFIKKM